MNNLEEIKSKEYRKASPVERVLLHAAATNDLYSDENELVEDAATEYYWLRYLYIEATKANIETSSHKEFSLLVGAILGKVSSVIEFI